ITLALLAIGLGGFALWRVLQGVADADGLGARWNAIVRRTAYTITGGIYAGLAGFAVSLIFGLRAAAADDDRAAREWTASLLSMPFGRWVVAVVGVCLIGAAIAAVARGWKATFQNRLELRSEIRPIVIGAGRIGFAARGLVFAVAGVFLVVAGWHAN